MGGKTARTESANRPRGYNAGHMKPNQLCKLLNIAPTTLRRWSAVEYAEFLSPSGRGINGAHRAYDDRDARILAWVAVMRAQNLSPDEILTALRNEHGNNWRALPPLPGGMAGDEPIAVVPREAVEERVRALQDRFTLELQAAHKEREALLAQVAELKTENSELRQELRAITLRILTMLEKEKRRK